MRPMRRTLTIDKDDLEAKTPAWDQCRGKKHKQALVCNLFWGHQSISFDDSSTHLPLNFRHSHMKMQSETFFCDKDEDISTYIPSSALPLLTDLEQRWPRHRSVFISITKKSCSVFKNTSFLLVTSLFIRLLTSIFSFSGSCPFRKKLTWIKLFLVVFKPCTINWKTVHN